DGVEFEADVRPHPRLTRPPSDPAPAKQAPEATRIPPLNRAWSPSKAARPFTSPNRPRQPTSKPESDRLLASAEVIGQVEGRPVRRRGVGRSRGDRRHHRYVEVRRSARTDELAADQIAALVDVEI